MARKTKWLLPFVAAALLSSSFPVMAKDSGNSVVTIVSYEELQKERDSARETKISDTSKSSAAAASTKKAAASATNKSTASKSVKTSDTSKTTAVSSSGKTTSVSKKSSSSTKTTAKDTKKKSTSTSVKKTDKKSDSVPLIEVGLLSGNSKVSITGVDKFYAANASGKKLASYDKGERVSVTISGKKIMINGKKMDSTVYLKSYGSGAAFRVKGNTYRGSIKLIPSAWNSGITVVNDVSLEQYLYGVVPSEVSPSWKADALKAQAVAARTYALSHKDYYRSGGYDVTDDTRSQVYMGYSGEYQSTNSAVDATRGEIITYGGKPIEALFHANGGGYTENSENVWGSKIPYLRGVPEESYSVINKAWTKTISADSLAKSLGIGKLKKIKLSKLKKGPMKVSDRGVSGRVKQIVFTGSKKTKTVTGNDFQSMYGLSSTLFDLNVKGKNVIVTGYGSGHGLGMSQWGAEAMAEKHGGSADYYRQILTHYYTGTKIEKKY